MYRDPQLAVRGNDRIWNKHDGIKSYFRSSRTPPNEEQSAAY